MSAGDCENCPTCTRARHEAEAAAGIRCSVCLQRYNPPVRIPSPTPGFCLSCAPASTESAQRAAERVASAGRAS